MIQKKRGITHCTYFTLRLKISTFVRSGLRPETPKTKMKEKSSEFALKERLLIQYADKYYPVKKYAVDLSDLTEKKKIEYLSPDKKWFLFLIYLQIF